MQGKEMEDKKCNCWRKTECPLGNRCLTSGIVYLATVSTDEKTETYVGLTDTPFKSRYANHKQSFNKSTYKNQTELSKYIWDLKEKKKSFRLSWRILGRARRYSNTTKKCGLCTLEKYFIICHREMASLNKRSELGGSCRHATKFLLKNFC